MYKLLILLLFIKALPAFAQLPAGRYLKVKDDGSGFELFTLSYTSPTRLADSTAVLRAIITNGLNTKQNSLGYTPYNATNPNSYISSITGANVTTALGFTPYNATNPNGFISVVPAQDYNTLLNKPVIPTNTNQLTNGALFLVAADIAGKLNKTDTSAMLANYQSSINGKQPIGNYATTAQNAAKVNIIDTAGMLSNYQTAINGKLASNGTITEAQVTNLVSDLAAKAPIANPALTGTVNTTGSFGITAGAGSGGTVTQLTSRTTGVTLNKISGAITTNATSLAAGAEASFVVTNSTVAIGDVVLVTARSGQTASTSIPFVTAVANGSFTITLSNFNAATADTGAMIINFVVIKAVSN